MTKIDIISGFLGAGKTTLIRKLIEEVFKGEKLVLIENEYGEVGIDGGFLKDSGIQISEMNSGCICCTLVGDFDKNLREVIATYTPDRILIEPSGVGKLSDVMTSVIKLEEELDVKLNGLVTVVNAIKAKKQMKAFGEFFNNQIEYATTIVLSRTQGMDEAKLEECVKDMQTLNSKAAIITTPWDSIKGEMILKVLEGQDNLEMKTLAEAEHERHEHEHHHHHDHDHEHEHHHEHGEDCTCGCHDHDHEHHHHHHADDVFISWGKETPHKFEKATIENAMKKFAETEDYGIVVRSKGIVESTDGEWIYFDFVDGDYELRTGEPDYTGRLVVIGAELKEHEIEELFGL
ncbi:MAG: GTP-binding protein [Lachnospiraceae bacterium]|nr:GTP-binding protein [Lachnospiraceae bacterium]